MNKDSSFFTVNKLLRSMVFIFIDTFFSLYFFTLVNYRILPMAKYYLFTYLFLFIGFFLIRNFMKKEISHIFAYNVDKINNFFTIEKKSIKLIIKSSDEKSKTFNISAKSQNINVINEDNKKVIYISEDGGYKKLLKNYYWTNIILQDITDSSSSKTYDLSTEQIFIDTKEKTHLGDISKRTIRTVSIGNKTKTAVKSYKQLSIQYYILNYCL